MSAVKTRRTSLLYRACQQILRLYLGGICKIEVIGAQLPEGPFVISMNHQSAADMFMYMAVLRQPIKFFTKQELLAIPVLGKILRRWCIPVDRGRPDRQALMLSVEALRSGYVLSVFPEGTRNRELAEGHGGAVVIAARAGVPVVPGGISGAYRPFRGKTVVRFGEPLTFTGSLNRQQRVEATQILMQRIRALRDAQEAEPRKADG